MLCDAIMCWIEWIVKDPLPISFMEYAAHIVVADENYFTTMFMNSPYCDDLVGFFQLMAIGQMLI